MAQNSYHPIEHFKRPFMIIAGFEASNIFRLYNGKALCCQTMQVVKYDIGIVDISNRIVQQFRITTKIEQSAESVDRSEYTIKGCIDATGM